MFLCTKCAKKNLSRRGWTWVHPFMTSFGPCELCNKVGTCHDVPSWMDWAWKQRKIKKATP